MSLLSLSLFSGAVLLSIPSASLAAACCGGGFAVPSIIAGDDKAQLTTSYSFTEVSVDNVDSSGIWKKWEDHQRVQTLRMDGAHIFQDRWQAGLSIPIVQRSKLDQTYSGLGDVSTSLAYEYLPDWNYNPYRPKGIGFLQITMPTGKSRAESEIGGLDSRGNGYWAIGVGTLLTKAIGRCDVFSSLELHRSFAKTFSNAQMSGTIKPGYGGNLGIGGGYNLKSVRIGTSVSWTHEDPVDIEGTSSSTGTPERYATATLSASYLVNDEWAGVLSYADQTLIGDPVNTSLGRTLALMIQKRWGR